MAEQVNQVACLRIPKEPHNLLLPNVSVAEVIPYQMPEKAQGPEWFQGYFTWRNTRVPVISLEALNDEASLEITERSRYAVINRQSEKALFDFFAVPIKDLPTLVRVYESDIKAADKTLKASEHAVVELDQQVVVIPDLEKLELLASQITG
jgi:chemosensory pili system protein ChpC